MNAATPPAGEEVPTVYVELIESPAPRRWWRRRPQKWRWVARSGGNNRILATSGESYVNRGDALSTIQLIFGYRVNVYLRQPQLGNVAIRSARQ